MKPKFRVNMTLDEWKEHQEEEIRKKKLLEQQRQIRKVAIYLFTWGAPLVLIYIGLAPYFENTIQYNGLIYLILGIIWIVLSINYTKKDKPRYKKQHRKRTKRRKPRRF